MPAIFVKSAGSHWALLRGRLGLKAQFEHNVRLYSEQDPNETRTRAFTMMASIVLGWYGLPSKIVIAGAG